MVAFYHRILRNLFRLDTDNHFDIERLKVKKKRSLLCVCVRACLLDCLHVG